MEHGAQRHVLRHGELQETGRRCRQQVALANAPRSQLRGRGGCPLNREIAVTRQKAEAGEAARTANGALCVQKIGKATLKRFALDFASCPLIQVRYTHRGSPAMKVARIYRPLRTAKEKFIAAA
jgi:hypothetical protein